MTGAFVFTIISISLCPSINNTSLETTAEESVNPQIFEELL